MPKYVVDGVWLGKPYPASTLHVQGPAVVGIGPVDETVKRLRLTVMPGVVDRHVHLALMQRQALADGPVVEVHDLGWVPDEIERIRDDPPSGVTVKVAGPFHTAPGGYPSGRPWAPDAAVRPVTSTIDAHRAVSDVASAGCDVLKVALHSDMPVLNDVLLHTLVAAAHAIGLPVAVHAEGPGQATRAIDAGADILAHAPWSERLTNDDLVRGRHMTWYSTLAIHGAEDRARAIDNIRRFRAVGGRVVYGTDSPNGGATVGLREVELCALEAAGLHGNELLTALTGEEAADSVPVARLMVSSRPLPTSAAEAAAWYAGSRRFTTMRL